MQEVRATKEPPMTERNPMTRDRRWVLPWLPLGVAVLTLATAAACAPREEEVSWPEWIYQPTSEIIEADPEEKPLSGVVNRTVQRANPACRL